ncbi:hypothetical protein [Streptomyces xantholiticus]|uniref:hypothetical protein n=1 Tax=Streptomyces xantholiticus TaxID=68285 RepID=UPI0016787B8C|nr:hypothetical protein [Streptomyces xantholiticus]GGW32608.1 hypothetical protein GCM10010381_16720 [Streptomyces xantholiticus]
MALHPAPRLIPGVPHHYGPDPAAGWDECFAGAMTIRHWSAGPVPPLYVPGPVLRTGGNEVWVLELERAAGGTRGAPAGEGADGQATGPARPVCPVLYRFAAADLIAEAKVDTSV